jgi:branched-chain amino acid transport system permease protein
MTTALQFYIGTLLVYAGVSIIACWGLDLQYGSTGIPNFAFIVFQAMGAYVAAVLTLGPASHNAVISYEQYDFGANLPYPLSVLIATLAGAALSVPIGLLLMKRLREDYLAITLLVLSLIATVVVEADVGLVNGSQGLYNVPEPFSGVFTVSAENWVYVGIVAIGVVICALVVRRIVRSPIDRILRSIRENELAAASLGKNVGGTKLATFVVGNAMAAFSGALLIQFIGAWAPSGWDYAETFVYLSAIIIGGRARRGGVVVGAVLLCVGISEAVRYLPTFGAPSLIGAIQFMFIGGLIIAFLWWRPQGILPEKKHTFAIDAR